MTRGASTHLRNETNREIEMTEMGNLRFRTEAELAEAGTPWTGGPWTESMRGRLEAYPAGH